MTSVIIDKAAALLMLGLLNCLLVSISACGPGRFGFRRRLPRKLTPLVFKESVPPNVNEFALSASGPSLGRLTRSHLKFKELVPNYHGDVVFEDSEGNGEDRIMSLRCTEKLNTLAISVLNQFPGVRIRVTEAFDQEGFHSPESLHYEGRALDLTTSDRDRSKLGVIARLAVESGFDFVYYSSRSHIHVSVKSETADAYARSGGCFSGIAEVHTPNGLKKMKDLKLGEKVLATCSDNKLCFSEVIVFIDRDDKKLSMHVVIETESGNRLTATPSHLVFIEKDKNNNDITHAFSTFAKNVEIGHYVYVKRSNELTVGDVRLEKVVNISSSVEHGAYAPLTNEGNIVVNNFVASCYAMVNDHSLANVAFSPVRIAHNFKQATFHFLKKLSLRKSPKRTNKSEKSQNGVYWFAAMLYTFGYHLLPERYLYQ